MRRARLLLVFAVFLCSSDISNLINCKNEKSDENSKAEIGVSLGTVTTTEGQGLDDMTPPPTDTKSDKSKSESEKPTSSTEDEDGYVLFKRFRTDCPNDDLDFKKLYKEKCPNSSSHISALEIPTDRSVSDKDKMEINYQNKRILNREITVGVFGNKVPAHSPKLGFKLLGMSAAIYLQMCPIVPVDFITNALKLYHDLHWLTGQGRTDVLTEVDYKWIIKLLNNCSANSKPFTAHTDNCKEELLGASSCRNFICTSSEYEFNLYRTDPLVDLMWKVYEVVHAVCFSTFEEGYRMYHKYAQAIMDLFTQPIKLRWFNQMADNMFWRRALGPNYELNLVNMERCTQETITRAALSYRLPKNTITDRPRLSGDAGHTQERRSENKLIEIPRIITDKPSVGRDVGETPPIKKCIPDNKNAVIQFALVQDVTTSYADFVQQLATIMPDFLKTLSDEFPETQFALTSFVDYPWIDKNGGFLGEGGYCYKMAEPFTKAHGPIISGISGLHIQSGGRDYPESSLTGILYTAVDAKLGWASTPIINGKKVYKVIAVTTDEEWKSKEEPYQAGDTESIPEIRDDAKGDGSDTCENYPPSATLVREVLEKKDIYLIALIAPEKMNTWKGYFTKYQFSPDRSKLVSLDLTEASEFAKSLVKQFSDLIRDDQCGKG